MKKTIWVVVVVIAIILVIAFAGKGASETGPIKIGVIGPLTGEAAAYGQSVQDGVTLAVEEINNAGGINGRKVEAIYEDGKCNGKDAASAAQKLVNIDQVKVIVGGTCSGETFGAAPITQPAKVILFSPVSSAAGISTIGDFVFRNHPSDNEAGEQLAGYMASKYKNIAIVSEQTDYAQGIRSTFIDDVKAKGGSIVFDESFTSGTKDFRSIASKLKDSKPEAIFLCAQTGPNAAQLAKQLRDLGSTAQFFTAYLTGPEFVKANAAVEGTIIIDVPGLSTDEKGQKLLADYKVKYNREPNYKFFVGTSYDATHILADAIAKDGLDTTKINTYLHSLKDYTGSIGTYSLDPKGSDVVGLGFAFRQIKNGELIELK